MRTRSTRPVRTASRCGLRLRNGDRKRMPEYDPLHVARCTSQEKGEGLGPVGGIEDEAVLGREPTGRLTFRRRVAVALPQPIHHHQREAGCGMRDADVVVSERSEEHTSELQSRPHLVCRLLLEKKKKQKSTSRAVLVLRVS